MLNQSIRPLSKNLIIIYGGKIFQMIIITNVAIQTARYHKQYVKYELTVIYYKRYTEQKIPRNNLHKSPKM